MHGELVSNTALIVLNDVRSNKSLNYGRPNVKGQPFTNLSRGLA